MFANIFFEIGICLAAQGPTLPNFFFWVGLGGSCIFRLRIQGWLNFLKKPVETSYFRSSVHFSIPRNDEQLAIYESTSLLYDLLQQIQNVSPAQGRLIQQKTNQIEEFIGCFFWCLANLDFFPKQLLLYIIISYTLKNLTWQQAKLSDEHQPLNLGSAMLVCRKEIFRYLSPNSMMPATKIVMVLDTSACTRGFQPVQLQL